MKLTEHLKNFGHVFWRRSFVFALLSGALLSCATPEKIAYFQDTAEQEKTIKVPQATVRLQPGDMISIIVNTKDPESASILNLPYVSQRLGSSSKEGTYNTQMSGYTLDPQGNIDFPIVGNINLMGLTRSEASAKIKQVLLDKHLVSDVFNAVVTVEFMNLGVSILGEVNRPGRFALPKDNLTILDALALAGDLTIYGNRENVRVVRTEGDIQQTHIVDLCSAESVLNSPVYFLKQNDVIYVEPNEVKMRQSTVNGNNVRSSSFWISIASLLTTITLFFIRK
ncbi:MAG: polysaccharide biosynthesis/export family protein [Bacteroidales bacterium]|nr:polysaccharide biosynthesis/export family protein [Bacteroidales bacterium]